MFTRFVFFQKLLVCKSKTLLTLKSSLAIDAKERSKSSFTC